MEINEQLAWLAGFIDGEGSIGIYNEKDKRKGSNYSRFRPSLQIANTNKNSLIFAKEIIGDGNVIEQKGRYIKNPNNKICYVYNLRKPSKLVDILNLLIPFLKIKQRQAILLADYCDRRIAIKGKGRYAPYENEDY